MPEERLSISADDIEGLLPALDARAVKKPYVIEGRNFRHDVQGPFSGFGNKYLAKDIVADPALTYTFRVNNDTFILSTGVVLAYDVTAQSFYVAFAFVDTDQIWPWSQAEVQGKFYFCKLGVGVLEYDPAAHTWAKVTSIYIPTNARCVTQCRNRLIILGDTQFAWSANGDGTDLEPSLTTGAGNEIVALIGGTAFMVFEISDGFLVYTSTGILISEFSPGVTPFRHRTLTKAEKAISPFAIVAIDFGVQIFIDRKGLRSVTGPKVEVYQPVFSEYVTNTLLRGRNLANYSTFRLSYSVDFQLLFLSVATEADLVLYEYAYVMYRPVEKWGIFNELHYMLGEVAITTGVDTGFNYGYLDENGRFHKFTQQNFREVTPLEGIVYEFFQEFDMPARSQDGIYVLPSMGIGDSDSLVKRLIEYPTGWYVFDELLLFEELETEAAETVTVFDGSVYVFQSIGSSGDGLGRMLLDVAPSQLSGLDSYIIVGPFRYTSVRYSDELGMVTDIAIGMEGEGVASESEDWLLEVLPSEDWLVDVLPDEDWGLGETAFNQYDARIIGTNDGETEFTGEDLIDLEAIGKTNRYSSTTTGIYHNVKIEALEFPQSFHLKSLELGGTLVGRL